jgi:glycosyl transferase family 25
MKVFVINLERSVDRKKHITNELNRFGVEFEIFNAVDGNVNLKYREKYYSEIIRLLCYANSLSNSQIGCFASHFELWEKCVAINENIIILEDDIDLMLNFKEGMEKIHQNISKLEYIRLWGIFDRKSTLINSDIKLYNKGPSGMQGYAITPLAASRLIQHAKIWNQPVDDYIDKYWIHGVLPFCITPHMVMCTDELPSTLTNNSKTKTLLKLTRELYKFTHVIRKKIFDLNHLKKYEEFS